MPSGFTTYKRSNEVNHMPSTSLARWETYSPVSIGLNDMFNRLDAFADSNALSYPPYNILKIDEFTQEIQIALAGFSKEEIQVSTEKGVLSLHANRKEEEEVGTYMHRGIATRGVNRNWQLADNAVVDDVSYIDGLLRVVIKLEVPESQKHKVLPIN